MMQPFVSTTALAGLAMMAVTLMPYSKHNAVEASSNSFEKPFQDAFKNLDHSPCVSLFHRNGRIGCGTADHDMQYGPLYYYDGSSKLNVNSNFVAVIEEFALEVDIFDALIQAKSYGYLQGILVLNSADSNDDGDYTSPGPMYPNGYGTPAANVGYGNIKFPWNPNGQGLTNYDMYGIPMIYVNDYETSNAIREVAQDGSKAPDIVARFNYYMGPDNTNSADCLAWKDASDDKWNPKCLPLGGSSVWGFAGSPPQNANNNRRRAAATAADEQESMQGSDTKESSASQTRKAEQQAQGDGRPSIMVATSIDATSLFHDLSPGANTAASNILTLLMAAYLVGKYADDATLDALPNRILFGFFQGESYGYIGSRGFLNDVFNFQCDDDMTVPVVSNDEDSEKGCLYPMRHSLKFQDIGDIAGMLTVDQVGYPLANANLFVHNEGNDGTMGTFLANVLKATYTKKYTVVASEAGDNNNGNGYPYPPTPLTSLLSLTGGAVDGAVLSGYDYIFAKRPPYQSHLNTVDNIQMNYKSVASAATIMARAAIAAAYDDGSFDYETSSQYAANLIPALDYNDELLVELADCLFEDGTCDLLSKHAAMEAKNEAARTGFNIGSGEALGNPPNFYVGIYSYLYGQPFVQVGDKIYGSYNGDEYGNKNTDAIGIQPRMLELAIRNMLNDFLGRGAFLDEEGNEVAAASCKKASDCADAGYCVAAGDAATCSANKVCVCTRSHFHQALDESIIPAVNKEPGFFEIDANDAGLSALYTEPFWSSEVGVSLYRDSKTTPGFITLAASAVVVVICFFVTVIVKVSMKKQKLY
mmetsp:Transcript_28826/g.81320  ORF Transcript_28826/g.81320 Transcript_28826/m.81320 type:complete len:815 (-) Transcript_28826:91-2535(-)